ncbi:MAG: hypothetical protein ACR2HX_00370, partial [Pyrinomonadaceae bacterium]
MVTEISGLTVDPSTGGNGLSLSEALPSLENGFPLRPFQIVSLLDVLELFAEPFYVMSLRLWMYTSELKEAIHRESGQDKLSETNKAHAKETLK